MLLLVLVCFKHSSKQTKPCKRWELPFVAVVGYALPISLGERSLGGHLN